MLVVIRGAGDIATGIAARLHAAGCEVVMCDIERPTTVRRTVAFSEAIRLGACEVEGVRARRVGSVQDARAVARSGDVAVLVDPEAACVRGAADCRARDCGLPCGTRRRTLREVLEYLPQSTNQYSRRRLFVFRGWAVLGEVGR